MPYTLRELGEGDAAPAMALVKRVFDEFEAPGYPARGVAEFYDFIRPAEITNGMRAGTIKLWGAFAGDAPAGVAAARGADHLSLLFVDKRRHRRGVARALLGAVLDHCRAWGGAALTVHAGPYAWRLTGGWASRPPAPSGR